MKEIYPQVGLSRLCGLFGKTRQAYYDLNWRSEETQMEVALILTEISRIRMDLPRIGGLKLFNMLQNVLSEHHIKIGRDGFFDLMRDNDLLVRVTRRYISTTQSKHHFYKWPNLIVDFVPNAPEQLWVSDITYLSTEAGFIYLFLITDAYSKQIMGYHLSQRLWAKSCLIALKKALQARQYPKRRLIHHSDRGIQYCCDLYVTHLQEHKIEISMTQNGSPYENAIAERINGILKSEFSLNRTFKSYSDTIEPVARAISAYNNLRPHLSIDFLTPQQAHLTSGMTVKKWAAKKADAHTFAGD